MGGCELFTRGNLMNFSEGPETLLLAKTLLLLREPCACLKSTKEVLLLFTIYSFTLKRAGSVGDFRRLSARRPSCELIVTSRSTFYITAVQTKDTCMVISLTFIQYTPSLISTPIRDEQPRV